MVKMVETYRSLACLTSPTTKRTRPGWSAMGMVLTVHVLMAGASVGSTVSASDSNRYTRRQLVDLHVSATETEQASDLNSNLNKLKLFQTRQGTESVIVPTTPMPNITPEPTRTFRPTIVTHDDGVVSRPPFGISAMPFFPTGRPSDSPAPSPSPSNEPTVSPTTSQAPSQLATPSPTDTYGPTPSPSSSPTLSPSKGTQQPSNRPTPLTTPIPITAPPTPNPTPRPTTFTPTFAPSTFKAPTTSPTRKPSGSPSATPSKKPTNPPSSTPSKKPTNPPSSTPSKKPTNQPSSTPSKKPTNQPSSTPSKKPTNPPSLALDTSSPTDLPSLPSLQPFLAPFKGPSAKPSPQSSSAPSVSRKPSPSPTTPKPIVAPIEFPGNPSLRPSTDGTTPTHAPSRRDLESFVPTVQMVPVGIIPLTPFEVLLAFPDPLSETDVQASASELQVIVTDYLLQELADQDFVDGVELMGFDLSVAASGNSTRPITSQRRFLRNLQEDVLQIYTYNVDGTAEFSSEEGVNVDTSALARSVDSSVNDAFDGPEKQAEFTQYVKEHPDSTLVNNTLAAGVETQPLPSESGKSKPTTVAIVFGFAIVGLALLSLVFYALTWWKGYKKKAAHRKRERQGVHAAYSKPAATNSTIGAQPMQQQQAPSQAAPGFLASSNVTAVRDDSSEDDSSYQGVGSETDSDKDNDAFARELKLAATLDMRAWEDYQKKRKSFEQQGMVVGRAPAENNRNVGLAAGTVAAGAAVAGVAMHDATTYRDNDDDDEGDYTGDEGFEITDSGSALIIEPADSGDDYQSAISGTTFPYGDEQETRRIDPPGPRSSSIQPSPRKMNDPVGVRVSQLAIVSPTEEERIEFTTEGFAQSPNNYYSEDYSEDSYDPAVFMMNSLTANTGTVVSQAREAPRSSPMQSASASIPSSQAIQTSPNSSQNNLRGSPISASAIPVVNEFPPMDDDDTENQEPSKDSNSLQQSLLTIDIVKEVQKLANFVKKYERKREKEKTKEAEKEERALAAVSGAGGDSRSVSVSYDLLSEGANSAGRINNLRDAIAYGDDESESESSQSSISSGGDYGTRDRRNVQNRLSALEQSVPFVDDEDFDESSVDSEQDRPMSTQGSDDSRLGIQPFGVQKSMAAQPDVEASRRRIAARQAPQPVSRPPVTKPVSKPPVTRNAFPSTALSPIAGTPDTRDEYDGSPSTRRTPLDDISRNVTPVRTPELRKASHMSPGSSPPGTSENNGRGGFHDSVRANHETNESSRRMSPRGSPLGSPGTSGSPRKSPQGSPHHGAADGIHESLRFNLGTSESQERFPPKPPSGRKKQNLNSLRKHEAILDAKPEVMSALAPSYEEITRDMSPRRGEESPGVKTTPRRSANRGFNSIISMFEAKPTKGAIFPPSENWQYNY